MKIRDIFKVRNVAGEYLVVNQGQTNADMTHVISLNETAFLLWEKLSGKDFEIDDATEVLVTTYGIPQKQALQDAQKWIDRLVSCKVIDA